MCQLSVLSHHWWQLENISLISMLTFLWPVQLFKLFQSIYLKVVNSETLMKCFDPFEALQGYSLHQYLRWVQQWYFSDLCDLSNMFPKTTIRSYNKVWSHWSQDLGNIENKIIFINFMLIKYCFEGGGITKFYLF